MSNLSYLYTFAWQLENGYRQKIEDEKGYSSAYIISLSDKYAKDMAELIMELLKQAKVKAP